MMMELYANAVGTTAVLVVSGRVTAEDATALKDRLASELTAHGHRLVVDLARVEFMGSAGLGALITAIKDARAHQGDVVLTASSVVVQTLLHVSGLLGFVSHAATVAEAVTALNR
jgi:anti-sigma B factor antagonist